MAGARRPALEVVGADPQRDRRGGAARLRPAAAAREGRGGEDKARAHQHHSADPSGRCPSRACSPTAGVVVTGADVLAVRPHDEDVRLAAFAGHGERDRAPVGRERGRQELRAVLDVGDLPQAAAVRPDEVELGLLLACEVRAEEDPLAVGRPVGVVAGVERPRGDLRRWLPSASATKIARPPAGSLSGEFVRT